LSVPFQLVVLVVLQIGRNQITQFEPKSLVKKITFNFFSSFVIFFRTFSLVGHLKVVDAKPVAVVLVEAGVTGLPPQAARFAPVMVQSPLGSPFCLSPFQAALLSPLQ